MRGLITETDCKRPGLHKGWIEGRPVFISRNLDQSLLVLDIATGRVLTDRIYTDKEFEKNINKLRLEFHKEGNFNA